MSKLLIMLLGLLLITAPPVAAQTPTPVQIPIPVPEAQVSEIAGDGDKGLAGVNAANPVPGVSEQAIVLFGYARWLLQPGTAAELFGPFEPLIGRLGVFVVMSTGMGLAYALAYFGIYLIRAAVWLVQRISDNLIVLAVVLAVALIIAFGAAIWAFLDSIF